MTFARLRAGDWIALVAALGLLFAMAADWYSTDQGREARRIERLSEPEGALAGEAERLTRERAREAGEAAERNAWQADEPVDRVILGMLLATAVLALAAAFLRAAARRFEPPWTPSALAAVFAAGGAALVAYRILDEPGLDTGATVEAGAPLALVALGLVALGSAAGMRNEEAGRAFRELPPPKAEPPAGSAEQSAGSAEQSAGSAEQSAGSAEQSAGSAEPPAGSGAPPAGGRGASPARSERER